MNHRHEILFHLRNDCWRSNDPYEILDTTSVDRFFGYNCQAVAHNYYPIVKKLAKIMQVQHTKSDLWPIRALDGAAAQP